MYFGGERSHLIEQMPIGRVPSYGLTEAQRAVIDRLVEENPRHPLRRLLRLAGGTQFFVGTSNLGKMSEKAAAAHTLYEARRRIGAFRSTSPLPNSPFDVPQAHQRRTSSTRSRRPLRDQQGDAVHGGSHGDWREVRLHGWPQRDWGYHRQGHSVHGGPQRDWGYLRRSVRLWRGPLLKNASDGAVGSREDARSGLLHAY